MSRAQNKYIIILRHGPAPKDILNEKKFKAVIPEIVEYINKFAEPDIIFTSPRERCKQSSELLAEKFNCTVVVNTEVDRSEEGYEAGNLRAYEYGKFLKKHANNNIVICTHSSVYQSLVEGLVGIQHHRKVIHTSAISVYNLTKKELISFNWYPTGFQMPAE